MVRFALAAFLAAAMLVAPFGAAKNNRLAISRFGNEEVPIYTYPAESVGDKFATSQGEFQIVPRSSWDVFTPKNEKWGTLRLPAGDACASTSFVDSVMEFDGRVFVICHEGIDGIMEYKQGCLYRLVTLGRNREEKVVLRAVGNLVDVVRQEELAGTLAFEDGEWTFCSYSY